MKSLSQLTLLALAVIVSTPAWSINKCTSPNGSVTFQDAPCNAISQKSEPVRVQGERVGRTDVLETSKDTWKFVRSVDDMTGKRSCLVGSPEASAMRVLDGRITFFHVRIVIAVAKDASLLGVRTISDGDSFHNELSGSGVKLDNSDFMPLDLPVGRNTVVSSKNSEMLTALSTAKSMRLRLKMWPYETLLDTSPITTLGYAAAMRLANACADGG